MKSLASQLKRVDIGSLHQELKDSRGISLREYDTVCIFTHNHFKVVLAEVRNMVCASGTGLGYAFVVPCLTGFHYVDYQSVQQMYKEHYKNQKVHFSNTAIVLKVNQVNIFSRLDYVENLHEDLLMLMRRKFDSMFDTDYLCDFEEKWYLAVNNKKTLRGFEIHEYFHKQLHKGDLVFYHEDITNVLHYGVVKTRHTILNDKGEKHQVRFVCLVDELTQAEQDLKDKLVSSL